VVDEVKSNFAATAHCPLMVSPAPLHAVTAPVIVVEGTHAALGVGEFMVQAVLLGIIRCRTSPHFTILTVNRSRRRVYILAVMSCHVSLL
jgi:hypothetical protein